MNEDLTNGASEQSSQIARLTALVLEMKASFEQRLDRQEQEIAALREKIELRHYDTRPLWDLISGELEQMRAAIEELRAKVEDLRVGQEELRVKVEELNVKVEAVRHDLAAFRAETNHNLKLINHKFKDVFADIADVSARTAELERHFPIVEN